MLVTCFLDFRLQFRCLGNTHNVICRLQMPRVWTRVNRCYQTCTSSVKNILTHYQTTKNLDLSKLKAFAEDKINVTKQLEFVLGKEKTLWEKGENDGYQHFLLFPQCFQKASFTEVLEVGIAW